MHSSTPENTFHAHSALIAAHLIASIQKNQGRISFAEYMQQALYAPGLGYYAAGNIKIGKSGDFVTAPELSPLFAQCLARNFIPIISKTANANILEFGAGTGRMAADILIELEAYNALPGDYFILEVSPDLKKLQQHTLEELCPHLLPLVTWLSSLPTSFTGLILANEVLDAMPVRRFCISNHQLYEQYVSEDKGTLYLQNVLVDAKILKKLPAFIHHLCSEEHTQDYIFEWNATLDPWLRSVAGFMEQGMILIIDYGFPRSELYHLDRSMGTLMCHYQHKACHDPLSLPGLQDITAHVDFTQIAETATESGLDVLGFTNQASFLLNSGLIEILKENFYNLPEEERIQQNHAVQILSSPAEMGELFKVIALGKHCDDFLSFAEYDQRHRL